MVQSPGPAVHLPLILLRLLRGIPVTLSNMVRVWRTGKDEARIHFLHIPAYPHLGVNCSEVWETRGNAKPHPLGHVNGAKSWGRSSGILFGELRLDIFRTKFIS